MAGTILVTGATGKIGGEAMRILIERGQSLRVLVRDPEKGERLRRQGVEVIVGDLTRHETIAELFAGVESALLVLPAEPRLVEIGMHIVEAAAKARVRHIVYVSIAGAAADSTVGIMRWHRDVEAYIEDAGPDWTFLRPQWFMQNLLTSAQGVSGEHFFHGSMRDGKISAVDVRDVGAVAAEVLMGAGHSRRSYTLTGPAAHSNSEMASIMSSVLGKTVRYVDMPPEKLRKTLLDQGRPAWLAEQNVTMAQYFATGQGEITSNNVLEITGKPPIAFEQFVRDYAERFRQANSAG